MSDLDLILADAANNHGQGEYVPLTVLANSPEAYDDG